MTDSRDEDVPCSRSIEVYSDIQLEHLRELEFINLSSTKIELYIVKLILMKSPILKKLRIHIEEFYKLFHTLQHLPQSPATFLGFPGRLVVGETNPELHVTRDKLQGKARQGFIPG
ncbi:hypothetical protein Tco_1544853, partial [Tanacetum coccineum]